MKKFIRQGAGFKWKNKHEILKLNKIIPWQIVYLRCEKK